MSQSSLGEKTCSDDVPILVASTGNSSWFLIFCLLTNGVIVNYFYQFIQVYRILTVVFHLIFVYCLAIRCCSVQGISMHSVRSTMSCQLRQCCALKAAQVAHVWNVFFVHMVSKHMSHCVRTLGADVVTVI